MASLAKVQDRLIDARDHGDPAVSLEFNDVNDMIAEIRRLRSIVDVAARQDGALGDLARAYLRGYGRVAIRLND